MLPHHLIFTSQTLENCGTIIFSRCVANHCQPLRSTTTIAFIHHSSVIISATSRRYSTVKPATQICPGKTSWIFSSCMPPAPSRTTQNSNIVPFPLLHRSSRLDLGTTQVTSTGAATSHDYHQQTCYSSSSASVIFTHLLVRNMNHYDA
ncbi:hypothetical protein DEO72_LG8g1498 [Vigna unguiculata]|uniref:Uncharacterized protein n=1 Tax=Vigna unguiculata TaxID=3917 RepID=A0A4D6MRR4_VIGUN|nr:hypothetical protein DEO72_LG8g1498 [Vigna unguiculata]